MGVVTSLARRELRVTAGRMVPALVIIAFCFASICAMGNLRRSAERKIGGDNRRWLAADIAMTSSTPMDLTGFDVEHTQTLEVLTSARPMNSANTTLVSLKVVDARKYPFYGVVEIQGASSLPEALQHDAIVVSDELAQSGQVRINGVVFRVAAVLKEEPDRMASAPNAYPRVLMSFDAWQRSGLGRAGVQIVYRELLRGREVESLRARLEEQFADAFLLDYRDADPRIAAALENVGSVIRVLQWITLAMAAAAIAISVRQVIEARLDTIAMIKCLGAKPLQVVRIYILQILCLSAFAVVPGMAAGALMQLAAVRIANELLPLNLRFGWDWAVVGEGTSLMLAVALCVAVPVLWQAVRKRPNVLLRRAFHSSGWVWHAPAMRMLQWIESMTGRGAGVPRAQAGPALMALSATVTLLSASVMLKSSFIESLVAAIPIPRGDLYLTGITRTSVDGMRRVLESHSRIVDGVVTNPLIVVKWNGRPVVATCDGRVRGLLLSRQQASQMKVSEGGEVTLLAQGRSIREPVTQIREMDSVENHRRGVVLPCAVLDGLELSYEVGVTAKPGRQSEVRQMIQREFPWAALISRAELSETAKRIAGRAVVLLQVLTGQLLVSACILLALLVAARNRERSAEVAVWKALGASSRVVRKAFVLEFTWLGMLAGLVGAGCGWMIASALLSVVIAKGVAFAGVQPVLWLIPMSMMISVVTAWLSARRTLDAKPLDLLRAE